MLDERFLAAEISSGRVVGVSHLAKVTCNMKGLFLKMIVQVAPYVLLTARG